MDVTEQPATQTSVARNATSLVFLGIVIVFSVGSALYPNDALVATTRSITRDDIWILVAAAMVFLMQAGFLCYETGLARSSHTTTVAIKNLLDWGLSTISFTLVGFALAFGTSFNGWFGTDLFFLRNLDQYNVSVQGTLFYLFQLAFAGTAITLIFGSFVERCSLAAYSILSVFVAGIIYPIFAHWVWGNLLVESNEPWLASLGFHDFAGGAVVHLLGAVIAFIGVRMIGPRIGRFDEHGRPTEMKNHNIGMAVLGLVLLWFGWWGFNGGSHLEFNSSTITTILVTNLAAVSGLVGAGFYATLFQKRYMLTSKLIGGTVGGLVAITPGADVVTSYGAVSIGLIAGIGVAWSSDLLLRLKVDDALGVLPAHGTAAIIGLFLLPVFAKPDSFDNSIADQIVIQGIGVIACILWAAGASAPVFWMVSKWIGIRVDPERERIGTTIDGDEWPYRTEDDHEEDGEVIDDLDWNSVVATIQGGREH